MKLPGCGWGGGEAGDSSGQVTPTVCQCQPLLCVERGGVCGPGELARAPSSVHAHCFLQTQRAGLHEARETTRLGVRTTAGAEPRRQCAQCAGTGRPRGGRDWQRPAAPGARRSSPPPRQTKSGLGLGSWRPSRHLGRPVGGALSGRQAGALSTPPLPPPARPQLGSPCAGGRAGGREG